MSYNPVRLELIKNAVGSVVDEMVLTVIRIAYSSIMKDTMDLSSAFCDRQGRMIAQGLSVPLHLGSIPDALEAVIAAYGDDLAQGDVVILNDPYHGGMHLPDIFMFRPVFLGRHLLGYAVLVAHHNDMGGRVPGSSAADSTEIFQEGLRIPPLKLYEGDRVNRTLMDMIALNVRQPEVVLGDIQAQLAACRTCERGMIEIAARYGIEELERYFGELLDYSERAARAAISAIPDGTYRFTDYLDDDGINFGKPVTIAVALIIHGDTMTVDFAGTSAQVDGAINATLSFTKSAIYFVVRTIMETDVPNSAGFFRPIEVVADLGLIVNPRSPAACAARGVTGGRVVGALVGAPPQAVPHRVRAPGEGGTTSYSIAGYDRDGAYSQFREAVMGAWGGGLAREGIDGAANPALNVGNAPIEVVENTAPIRVERYELVSDSGGPGKWRGGMSVLRQLRYLGERATFQLRSDRHDHPPFGVAGGKPGAPSMTLFDTTEAWEELPTKFVRPILRGQAMRHVTAGAGGYGEPFERDPASVLDDVWNGKVTPQGAEHYYGVAVSGPPWKIDEARTRQLRNNSGDSSCND